MDEPEITQPATSASEASSISREDCPIEDVVPTTESLEPAIEIPTTTTDVIADTGTSTTASTSTTTSETTSTTNSITSTNGHKKNQNIPPWRSYNGPKLYVKPVSRNSNQQIIHKAIAKALEGAANANTLKKIQESIQANTKTCNHFLILFRNYQFKGIYDYNEKLATITKLDGLGPKTICPENIVRFYKFDSARRAFTEVETKRIGPTIIGISVSTFNTK